MTVELSGIPIMIISENTDIISEINTTWSDFITDNKPIGKLNVSTENTNIKSKIYSSENTYFSNDVLTSDNWHSKGRYDFNWGEGTLKAPKREHYHLACIKPFLTYIWTIYLLREKKLLMHACGVRKDGRGYVFSGPSESGKSTVAKKSSSHEIFGDDSIILHIEDSRVKMSSSMLSGEHPACENRTETVESVYFIEKNKRMELEKMSAPDTFYNLLRNTHAYLLFGRKSPELFIQLFKTVPFYINLIPFYRLVSFREDDIWKII